jgi:HSP20 family molecular chaperone IbpA
MNQDVAVHQKNGLSPARAYQRRTASPPVDVFENADELLIVADVPGVASDGIDLHVEDGNLVLSARREDVEFSATYRVPPVVDTAAISAETKHGTLVVHLPKSAAAKARKIAVRSEKE